MKKRNKGKKALTAVGAVVAAGLTPGIIASTPGCLPALGSTAAITAADVVAIDGRAYGFDELYAKQQPDSLETSVDLPELEVTATYATRYGAIFIPSYDVADEDEAPGTETIYKSVERMPSFPGGDAALMKYINSHIQYPANALKNKVQGYVILQFVVTKTGEIGTIKVARSVDKDLDNEAIRIVKSLPRFTPGRQNGRVVSVWYTLPVTFKLPKETNINP